ncbi:MAG: hypothetical protein GDA56_20110 [Hormoscilla sp. GM7CHS1pb]|nr:hypothetical protein [Hormoscilla sp. GM7CHS1pb]
MTISLTAVELNAKNGLTLTADVMGDRAYVFLLDALRSDNDISLTSCAIVNQDANVVIIAGTLDSFLDAGSVRVRLYLFEVPATLGDPERHCILLFTGLSASYTASQFLANYTRSNAVTTFLDAESFLTDLAFSQQTLLLCTLDYDSPLYDRPPFPPGDDSGAPQSFIQAIRGHLTTGFTYQVTASLNTTISIPYSDGSGNSDVIPIQEALKAIKLDSLYNNSATLIAQTKFAQTGTRLVILYDVNASLTSGSIPFGIKLKSLGLEFPLGSEAKILPSLDLVGQVEIGVWLDMKAAFNLDGKYLSLEFSHFPSFGDLAAKFSGFDLGKSLTRFLPIANFSVLGEISIVELRLGIDFSTPSVDRIEFFFATQHGIPLLDLLTVYPALAVKIDYPFKAFRQVEVDVFGKWFLNKTEFDTALVVKNGHYQFWAQLALGHSLNLTDIVEDLLQGQVQALPNLNLSDMEFYGEKNGTDTSYELDLDIDSGWKVGILPLTLDNASLHVAFENGKLKEATVEATLEIADVFFNLTADYDAADEGWTFSGGTAPDSTISVGKFLEQLASDLDVSPHNNFLSHFEQIEITGFYVQYKTFRKRSSVLDLHLSLETGSNFDFLPLSDIIVRFQKVEEGVRWHFDGVADSSQQSHDVQSLVDYINQNHNVNLALPTSLTASGIDLQGLSAYYDSVAKHYGFTAYLDFGHKALIQLQIDLLHQVNGGYEKDVSGKLILHPGDEKNQLIFDLELKAEAGANEFIAYYEDESSKGFNLVTLLQAIEHDADFGQDFNINVRKALFARSKVGATTKSLFAIDMDAGIQLSGLGDLPLIGEELAAAESLTLALQIVYGMGGDFTKAELEKLNQDFNLNDVRFPETDITAKSPNVSTSLRLGNEKAIDMGLPLKVSDRHDGTLTHDSNGNFNPGDSPRAITLRQRPRQPRMTGLNGSPSSDRSGR